MAADPPAGESRVGGFLRERFLDGDGEPVNPIYLGGRAVVLVALFAWGWFFIPASIEANAAGRSYLHLINLPVHEAGHILFGLIGRFAGALGGSVLQCLFPFMFVAAFLWKRNPFGASVCLWWLGQNLMEVATYVNDARDLKLVLLGGVTGEDVADYHDWQYILGRLDLLTWDHTLARILDGTGIAFLLGAALWGGAVLHRQYRRRERT